VRRIRVINQYECPRCKALFSIDSEDGRNHGCPRCCLDSVEPHDSQECGDWVWYCVNCRRTHQREYSRLCQQCDHQWDDGDLSVESGYY
jgi:hypothetical protein